MIKYGINNIRDLVGHKVNLKMVYDNSICRIKKWKRVKAIEMKDTKYVWVMDQQLDSRKKCKKKGDKNEHLSLKWA